MNVKTKDWIRQEMRKVTHNGTLRIFFHLRFLMFSLRQSLSGINRQKKTSIR